MSFDYQLFKNHISSLDYLTYLNNSNTNFQETFNDFYNFYLKLIKQEIESTKQLNAKFCKNLNEKGKYSKNNKSPIELKKVCSFDSINNENEKLNIIIRTNLNKMTDETYHKISENLILQLLENKNTQIFKLLSQEIVNKCMYDIKYRNLYINLCSKIWNNKKIHYNLIEIVKHNNNFYAEYNVDNNIKTKIGPFHSVDKLKENVFSKINFKNYFIDFIQDLYYSKNLDYEHLVDNEFFNAKKKTLLLVELLSILFIEKHINFDIINLIIIDLLHQNNNFDNIKEIEFELLHIMIKFIFENNKSFKFIEYKKIIEHFKNILESILVNNISIISKRSIYFINEVIIIFQKILNNEKFDKNNKQNNDCKYKNIAIDDNNNDNNNNNNDNNIDDNSINNILNDIEQENIDNFYYQFKYINNIEQEKIITILVNKYLEKKNNEKYLKCMNKIKNNEFILFIETMIEKIINNLDDIILDIPDINENIKYLINNLELNNDLLNKLSDKMENLENEDDSDDDFSFR